VIFIGAYREGCLYKDLLSLHFLYEFHLIFSNEINEHFRNVIIELLADLLVNFVVVLGWRDWVFIRYWH